MVSTNIQPEKNEIRMYNKKIWRKQRKKQKSGSMMDEKFNIGSLALPLFQLLFKRSQGESRVTLKPDERLSLLLGNYDIVFELFFSPKYNRALSLEDDDVLKFS